MSKSALRRAPKKRSAAPNATIAGMPADRVPPPGSVMTTWTIYKKPKDYPTGYVLRASYVMDDGGLIVVDPLAWYCESVERLRAMVPPGLARFMPGPTDDAVILETWL